MVKAMAAVTGKSESDIVKLLKSDPTEIVDETRRDQRRYRGVYIDELMDVAVKLGLPFYCINPNPRLETGNPMWSEEATKERWESYLKTFNGIMVGSSPTTPSHAVAWIDGSIVDLTGKIKPTDALTFEVDWFLAIRRVETG